MGGTSPSTSRTTASPSRSGTGSSEKTEQVRRRERRASSFTGTQTLAEFVAALERPRRIMMMVKAGGRSTRCSSSSCRSSSRATSSSTAATPTSRTPSAARSDLREHGHQLRRHGRLRRRGGRAVRPVADARRRRRGVASACSPILEAIAAKTDSGPCVTYSAPTAPGHFVKMVHNGIEYGDMQLIAEAYDLLRARRWACGAARSADIFDEWNEGAAASRSSSRSPRKIFRVKRPGDRQAAGRHGARQGRPEGHRQVDAQVALDLGVAIPTIAAAVDARVLSTHEGRARRRRASASAASRAPAPPASTASSVHRRRARRALRREDLLLRAGHAR